MPSDHHCAECARGLARAVRRVLLAIGLGLGGIATLGAVAGAPGAETVRVSAVEVVDGDGRIQARLAATEAGPALTLLDADGVARATLAHDADGTRLYLADADGVTRVGIAQFAHGSGGFALHGEQSRGAAALYLKDGRGSLTFYAPDGAVTARVPASESP